jgi:hypothetical protein
MYRNSIQQDTRKARKKVGRNGEQMFVGCVEPQIRGDGGKSQMVAKSVSY